MKLKAIILTLLILTAGAVCTFAKPFPKEIREYLQEQKKIPTVRFDGVVLYNEDTLYIPVIPAKIKEVDKIEIVKTYPAGKNMDSLPDMVLFNNNYGLLKAVKTSEDMLAVKNIPDLPEEILTGLIPQDILVPKGLVFPENLAGIKGDVKIPTIGSAKSPGFVGSKKSAPLPGGKRVENAKRTPLPAELKNKVFYVNNYQTEYLQVYSSEITEPLYSLKTSGVIKDVKAFKNGRFLIAATQKKKNLDIIDTEKECVIKHIDLTAFPTEIAIDEINKLAYVASEDDESLFVINLETFAIKEKIQLAGSPRRLAMSADGKRIAYTDVKSSNVYVLETDEEYSNKLITKYPNVTKMVLDDDCLYLISRTVPKLRVAAYDLLQDTRTAKTKHDRTTSKLNKQIEKENAYERTEDIMSGFDYIGGEDDNDDNLFAYSTSIKDFDTGDKPVDLAEKDGKIFVLCAGNNSVYIYDKAAQTITTSKLPVEGFSKSFGLIPGSDFAVITNMGAMKYTVFNTKTGTAVQTVPVSDYLNMTIISERAK